MLVPDTISALYAAQCAGAALFARDRSGRGRHVKVSLAECCAAFQPGADRRRGALRRQLQAPGRGAGGRFGTTDGFIVLLTLRQDMWERLCRRSGARRWIRRRRASPPTRCAASNAAEINRLVADVLLARSAREWIEALEKADVLCAEVQGYAQLRDHPQMRHMGYFGALRPAALRPAAGALPPGTDRSEPCPRRPSPASTRARSSPCWAATTDEIAALEAGGVVVATQARPLTETHMKTQRLDPRRVPLAFAARTPWRRTIRTSRSR
jgi:crotonobetainyl-CoA:carnitine CoA-transferase CaiB-like acyl-CoA transferase